MAAQGLRETLAAILAANASGYVQRRTDHFALVVRHESDRDEEMHQRRSLSRSFRLPRWRRRRLVGRLVGSATMGSSAA